MTDAKFKKDLDEVKSLGGDGKTTPSARTDDQTQIALFWLGKLPAEMEPHCPDGRDPDRDCDPWENARLFAVLNMALTDGYVAMVSHKNHYQFWRPVTAIRASGDPNWTPLLIDTAEPGLPVGSFDRRWRGG